MKKTTQKKTLVLGIIFLFLVSGVASSMHASVTFFDQLDQNHVGLDSAQKVANAKLWLVVLP